MPAKRGSYRKAERGSSESTQKRLDRNLRLAAEAVGGLGKWRVTEKTASKIVLQRVEETSAELRKSQFGQLATFELSFLFLLHFSLTPPSLAAVKCLLAIDSDRLTKK
jgi:hypothetical protein